MKSNVFAVLAVLSLAGQVQADEIGVGHEIAMLLEPQGKVLVDNGTGFRPAQAKMLLSSGDAILVGKDSGAIIVYNACAMIVKEATQFSLPERAPCAAGQSAFVQSSSIIAPAAQTFCDDFGNCELNASGGEQSVGMGGAVTVAPAASSITPVIVGGAYVAAVGLAAITSTVLEKEKPVSGQQP